MLNTFCYSDVQEGIVNVLSNPLFRMIEEHVGTACDLYMKGESSKERNEPPLRSTTESILILRRGIFIRLMAMYSRNPRIACEILPEEEEIDYDGDGGMVGQLTAWRERNAQSMSAPIGQDVVDQA